MKKEHPFVVKLRCRILKNNPKEPFMSIVNTLALESNRQIKINFDGGDLSLLYTGSSFSLWKVTKIIFLFHQNYFSRKKFCGYRFRLHVLLLKLSTVSINSLLRRVEFIDFCGWFLHASFLSDHFFRVIHMKK